MGAPNSSAVIPCAWVSAGSASTQAITAMLMRRHPRRGVANGWLLINFALLVIIISQGF